MNARVDHLLHAVLELPAEERSAVAAALADSLEGTDSPVVAQAWRQELLARRDAYRSGAVVATPWAEARARMSAQ
jgi:putative addiction module component (TIGR02574 family)